jgi:SNF2 family DNA or RNA helicase
MGLGKTVQAIAFMAWLRAEATAGRRSAAPILIVAPTGLLGTWRDEIGRHLAPPRLGPLTPAFGAALKSLREEDSFDDRDIDTGRAALRSEAWQDSGVVLTTYETLRDYHFSFAKTRFGLIVFDEVQKLKNPASQLTRAAKTLNGAFVLAMTGTPVENRLQDLWSIMDVAAPGLLGSSRDFERRHPADDVAALGALKAQLTEEADGRPPHMLRRLKTDALEGLPTKHIHRFEAEMPPLQARAYRDLVIRAAAGASGGTMGQGGMLSILAGMRGVSLHPVDPRLAVGDLDAYAQDSARLAHTLSVLQEIAAKREKALVFVEDLAMQDRLAGLIQTRFALRHTPIRINGGVPGIRRQELVRRFQEAPAGFDVMILSPKAGGVGLTLTAANHVIHLSRWWNPAVEDQATDRVYRIGQSRDVHVHLPMAVHPDPLIRATSFDLRLDALIERKRQLTRDLFLPPGGEEADLAELFREVSEPGPAPTEMTPASPDASPAPRSTTRAAGSLNWRVEAGEPRPTDEIMTFFAGRRISHVRIRDPYALCRRANRTAQIAFVRGLASAASSLEAVTVQYAPDVPGDSDDAAQRRDFGSAFAVQLPGGT